MVEQSVTANMEYYCGGKCSMIVLTKRAYGEKWR